MNPIIREKIFKIIEQNYVVLVPHQIGNSFRVFNSRGIMVLRIETDTKLNRYYIISGNDKTKFADIRWRELDSHVTRDQQDVLDIISACKKRIKQQEKLKELYNQMSDAEKQMNAVLNDILTNQK